MSAPKKRPNFFETEEGKAVRQTLKAMVADPSYRTEPSYTANIALYPDHRMPFVDKHMCYIRDHPATNPQHYLSNLRLITRINQPS